MYERYRKLKGVILPVLLVLGLWLMRGEPEDNARWRVGIALAVLLALGYVAEELWWIAQRRGRPCGTCGQPIHVKAFALSTKCPFCGGPV